MNIVVFEDSLYDNFYPLSLTKPIWELRLGCFSIRERIERSIDRSKNIFKGSMIYYYTRDYLKSFYQEKYGGININDSSFLNSRKITLFMNARVLPSRRFLDVERNKVYVMDDVPLLAVVDGKFMKDQGDEEVENISAFLLNNENLPVVEKEDTKW